MKKGLAAFCFLISSITFSIAGAGPMVLDAYAGFYSGARPGGDFPSCSVEIKSEANGQYTYTLNLGRDGKLTLIDDLTHPSRVTGLRDLREIDHERYVRWQSENGQDVQFSLSIWSEDRPAEGYVTGDVHSMSAKVGRAGNWFECNELRKVR